MTSPEAWFSIALRPRKPEGSLGRTAQDGHLDSLTAPEHIVFILHSFMCLEPIEDTDLYQTLQANCTDQQV